MKLVDNLWQDIANEQMLQMWPHLVKQRSINGYVAANHHANHDAVKFWIQSNRKCNQVCH